MNEFGEMIKVEQTSFLTGEVLYTAYYPLIEVNGQFVYIKDKDYPTNKVNADTRYKAQKLGEKYLEKIIDDYIATFDRC